MATKTLYVGNLPYSTTETQLAQHFAAYGVTSARIVEGRGFGFVDVEADKLDQAIEEKHDADLGGRKLIVNEARPRENRGGGGGYSGGGGGGYGGGDRSGGGYGDRDRGYGGGGGRGGDRGGRGGGGRRGW